VRHAYYKQCELELAPGSAVALYTDGLVERAGESLDDGLERLREVVRKGEVDLEHLGDRVVERLLPGGPSHDDAALLLASALPFGDAFLAEFPAEVEAIPLMRRMLGRWLVDAGATRADVDDLSLAAAEACANSIEHAYGLVSGVVEVRARKADEDAITVTVRDFGGWRPPRGTNRGRGLVLMEGLTDSVEVTRRNDGTIVELSRRIGAEAAA
jgi:anti-sigma regulatory factor (Ser/Thr protein kinase)